MDIIEQIAKEELGFDTLIATNSDRLDFKDVAVWSVKAALERAFLAGQQSTQNKDVSFADHIKGQHG